MTISPNERNKQLTNDSFFGEPSVELAPPPAIHWCLEQIWQRFHLRARLFLLEGDDLVLRDCVGAYRYCPEIGLRVYPGSIVWEIFKDGKAVDLTESYNQKGRPHTLPEPVTIKAVIPLKGPDILNGQDRPLGVLIVDTGEPPRPIEDRDFQYLEVLGMLIAEILQRCIIMERIQAIRQEKDRMDRQVSHIFRTRFTIIGGFARRITQAVLEPTSKKLAEIILDEAIKGEQALDAWRESRGKEGMGRRKS